MNVDFPLCRDSRHEAAVRGVIEGSVRFLTERLDRRLIAIVLTGSFSRGEGSVLEIGGELRVLGDIEFLVVLPNESDYRMLRRTMAGWSKEASDAMAGDGLRVELEFGPTEVDYLRKRALPSIFVYDLATHGKVVWGPHDLLKEIPAFGPERIPREDALHLLFNRTVEQLEAYDRIPALDRDAVLDVAYHRLKLVLDLAGSALAFQGQHETSYEARPGSFARLTAETPALASLLPQGFQAELVRAAGVKLAPSVETFFPFLDAPVEAQREELRRRVVAAIPALAALVRWELAGIVESQGPLTGLLGDYLRRQGFGRRLWDWTKLALHPMPAPLPVSYLRAARLFWRSTPRALFYTAAVLAYLNLVADGHAPRAISDLLPLRRSAVPRTAAEQRAAVTALWRWCVRNN